jgi:uncharacterized protein
VVREVRILACADLHGRAERITRVRDLVAEHHPAVLLLPGDLTHAGTGEEALTLLGTLPVPVLAVVGNMDGPRAVAEIQSSGGVSGAEPVLISGISFGGPHVRSRCDVLITHEPPYGTLDMASKVRHIGSRPVRDLMVKLRPRLLTCGHVHESPGVERVGETVVVNCTMGGGTVAGALIELTAEEVQARLL